MEFSWSTDYDAETLSNANQAFYLWEEREYDKAEPFLRMAAQQKYEYSMPNYALILLDVEHLKKL